MGMVILKLRTGELLFWFLLTPLRVACLVLSHSETQDRKWRKEKEHVSVLPQGAHCIREDRTRYKEHEGI